MTATAETFPSGGVPLLLDIFMPAAPSDVAAAPILHGSFGMLPQYRADTVSFAEALAENGIGAAMQDSPGQPRGAGPCMPMPPC